MLRCLDVIELSMLQVLKKGMKKLKPVTGSYDIKVNNTNNIVNMQVVETFTHEQVQSFVKDYLEMAASIQPSDFTLDIDCTDMKVLTPEMVTSLENSFGLYKQTGFKKILLKIKGNMVLKMQLTRLTRNTGLTNAEIVEV